MKLIKSRGEYKCEGCENPINKGDMYRKKSKSFGSPGKSHMENRNGIPTIVEHGFRIDVRYCETCAPNA
jgi:hypothetical protein